MRSSVRTLSAYDVALDSDGDGFGAGDRTGDGDGLGHGERLGSIQRGSDRRDDPDGGRSDHTRRDG